MCCIYIIYYILRHIKLEAELAEMNWRVKWEDIMFGTMEGERKLKRQGSTLSLTRVSSEKYALTLTSQHKNTYLREIIYHYICQRDSQTWSTFILMSKESYTV
jgi:hypothetical protein